MEEFKKINEEELENAAGGAAASNPNRRVVCNLQGGYLAVRTAPSFQYENEKQACKLHNGDVVQITGDYVSGTGLNGIPATYVWITDPKTGISGYVNAYYLSK